MTSILAPQPHPFPTSSIMSQMDSPNMVQMQDPTLQRRPKGEPEDKNRGRRRSRVKKDDDGEGSPGGGADGHSSGTDGPSRKRRRSRKGLDKKFECPQEGCGKSYSRAEHLYRHQLNHTPKQIYNCDFPDCLIQNSSDISTEFCVSEKIVSQLLLHIANEQGPTHRTEAQVTLGTEVRTGTPVKPGIRIKEELNRESGLRAVKCKNEDISWIRGRGVPELKMREFGSKRGIPI
ncbi:hypothetical protein G7Y89_g9049 [Cudoniella acicularis]|uniref:C2H2-type domain-containing protein n=1 Tax=Cudoniella acicularis TaxID=354080 RepID=A0A8H4W2A1_9HELO|nr:hypothetical protein G7Y89_g9049 [Cudoniella acicularis]